MKKNFFAFLVLFITVSSAYAQTVPGDVIVVFENPSDTEVSSATLADSGEHMSYIASVASELGAEVTLTYDGLSENANEIFALVHSDSKSEEELLEELLARPDVKGAQLNHIKKFTATPNDKYYDLLWGMKAINADKVWDKETGSDSVYVAVIDSGIDINHPDLAANIAKNYCRAYGVNRNYELVYSDSERYYRDEAAIGHGTHISGVIGAIGDNNTGVVGVNWKTKVVMFKTMYDGATMDALIIAALSDILARKKEGVNIAAVNMSLGGWESNIPSRVSNSGTAFWSAMKALSDSGIILCVAAGNEDQAVGVPAPCDDYRTYENGEPLDEYKKGQYCYPASYLNIDNMIVVAAASQDVNGKIIRSAEKDGEAYSNYSGTYVDIAAPGSHIVSTTPSNYMIYGDEIVERGVRNYASWSGTSMATPYVTGAVALLKSAYPNATGSQIKRAIVEGANKNYCTNDKNETVYKVPSNHTTGDTSKYGFLDIEAAYELLPEIIAEDAKTNSNSDSNSNSGSSSDSNSNTNSGSSDSDSSSDYGSNINSSSGSDDSGGGCEVGFMSAAAFILLFAVMKFRK